jgi:D-aminopeptidase
MATYWLTFRFHDNATSDERRDELYEAISQLATKWWIEPTSFLVFDSGHGIDSIAAKVKAAINPSIDLVLIGMPEVKSCRLIGKSDEYQTLVELVPFVKRV